MKKDTSSKRFISFAIPTLTFLAISLVVFSIFRAWFARETQTEFEILNFLVTCMAIAISVLTSLLAISQQKEYQPHVGIDASPKGGEGLTEGDQQEEESQ